MAKFLSVLLPLIPQIWKLLSGGWKIALVTLGLIGITGYTILVSWAAIRMEIVTAYDNRWYELDGHKEAERTQIIKSMQEDIRIIKHNQQTSTSDIRDIRNALMNRHK